MDKIEKAMKADEEPKKPRRLIPVDRFNPPPALLPLFVRPITVELGYFSFFFFFFYLFIQRRFV